MSAASSLTLYAINLLGKERKNEIEVILTHLSQISPVTVLLFDKKITFYDSSYIFFIVQQS